jgi:hypothetical protein
MSPLASKVMRRWKKGWGTGTNRNSSKFPRFRGSPEIEMNLNSEERKVQFWEKCLIFLFKEVLHFAIFLNWHFLKLGSRRY